MDDQLLTYDQAAAMLGLKKNTIYGMVATKRIPHVRLGPRLVRFSRSALDAWVAARAVEPNATERRRAG